LDSSPTHGTQNELVEQLDRVRWGNLESARLDTSALHQILESIESVPENTSWFELAIEWLLANLSQHEQINLAVFRSALEWLQQYTNLFQYFAFGVVALLCLMAILFVAQFASELSFPFVRGTSQAKPLNTPEAEVEVVDILALKDRQKLTALYQYFLKRLEYKGLEPNIRAKTSSEVAAILASYSSGLADQFNQFFPLMDEWLYANRAEDAEVQNKLTSQLMLMTDTVST
jgi:hypothetical protein